MERALPIDSNQRKEGGTTANNSEVQSKPSGDKSLTSTNVLNTVSVLSKDLSCDQANTRAQQPCRGEGADFGDVGVGDDSGIRGRKNIGNDGMDGLEFEEGSNEFGSSI